MVTLSLYAKIEESINASFELKKKKIPPYPSNIIP